MNDIDKMASLFDAYYKSKLAIRSFILDRLKELGSLKLGYDGEPQEVSITYLDEDDEACVFAADEICASKNGKEIMFRCSSDSTYYHRGEYVGDSEFNDDAAMYVFGNCIVWPDEDEE